MPPTDDVSEEERLQQLPQDGPTPFTPAPDDPIAAADVAELDQAVQGVLNDTHPATDTDVDAHEAYDAGTAAAAEVPAPNAASAVTDYHPDQTPPQNPEDTAL